MRKPWLQAPDFRPALHGPPAPGPPEGGHYVAYSSGRQYVERLLRLVAVVIAVLGLVDPAVTLPWRERPIVSVAIAPSARDSVRTQTPWTPDAARALQGRVVAALDRDFDVRAGLTPDSGAVVLIGDGSYPAGLSLSPSTVVSAVLPASTPDVPHIVQVDAPRRTHVMSRVPMAVEIECLACAQPGTRRVTPGSSSAAGRSSTIVVSSDGLEVARAAHTWQGNRPRARVVLDGLPLRSGPARFTVSLLDEADGRRPARALDTADLAVDIHERPLRVLFLNARPSWATHFIERALDDDPRFVALSATRLSRGVTTMDAGAPTTLPLADPDRFHVVIVGASELATKADVDALRAFARIRGGLVVFAPDRRPEGPALDLLPARDFTERLLPEPTALVPHVNASEFPAGPLTRSPVAQAFRPAPPGGPQPALWASELALPRSTLPGAAVLLRLAQPGSGTPAPAAIGSPLGEGFVIFSGALDAWRFRDRADGAFDRFWRDTIAAQAEAVPDPIEVTLDPAIAKPGDRISVRVRLRASAGPPGGDVRRTPATAATVRATLEASPSTARQAFRLWPDARPSAYHGVLNAPSRDGVYAVSVQLDGHQGIGRAAFRVEPGVCVARPAWNGLQAFVEARRGVLVTSDHLDRLVRHLAESVEPAETRRVRHPLQSAWWMLPFAACLGGEWWLRRRRGER
jgi:hypothetical protein